MAQQSPGIEFGAAHIADVLRGGRRAAIIDRGHDKLTTFALLAGLSKPIVASCINQLIDLGHLRRSPGQFPTISLNPSGWEVMRGTGDVHFAVPKEPKADAQALQPFDLPCFEMLRSLRKSIAAKRQIAAYLVFSDAALQQMAAVRPTTLEAFAHVKGVGSRKLEDLGETFCAAIAEHALAAGLETNLLSAAAVSRPAERAASSGGSSSASRRKLIASEHFRNARNLADVASELGVTLGTASGYLADFITREKPDSINCWVDSHAQQTIAQAIEEIGDNGQLRPVFDRLETAFSYDQIRIVLAHRRAMLGTSASDSQPS